MLWEYNNEGKMNLSSLLEGNMQKLKDEIKNKIIEVGKKRFKKEGYVNTSMKDIASDAGISTGNIYRYFLTKEKLLDEILKEIEVEIDNFFSNVLTNMENEDAEIFFNVLIENIIRISKEKKDELKILFKAESEKQYISFENKIIKEFIEKIIYTSKTLKTKKEIDKDLCEAIARSFFEGFVNIVKNNLDDEQILRNKLEAYKAIMITDIGKRIKEVIQC